MHAILEHDTITIKHGDKSVKLFRIISTTGIMVKKPVIDKVNALIMWEDEFIPRHTIGGYVENINCLEGNSWIDAQAKVWGNAKIINSYIVDSAKVYDSAIVNSSFISNIATICNNSEVTNSWIADQVVVKQNSKITDSKLFNSSLIFGNAQVTGSVISNGCYVMKNAVVERCILKDTAMVGGDAKVIGCQLSNRATFTTGVHESKNVDFDIELKSVIPDAFYETDF